MRLSLFLAIVFMAAFPIFAQAEAEAEVEEITVSGIVMDVDSISLMMNVRYFDKHNMSMDEVSIRVPKHLKISCGTRNISFSDIKQSDKITVTFYADDASGFKAKRITDMNQANR